MENRTEPTVSLSLTVKDAAAALEFYAAAFGARELFRMPKPDGSVRHAEFMIGNTHVYISGEAEAWHAFAMPEGTMASCLFIIATDDCDKSHARAVEAGAVSLNAPMDRFFGARSSLLRDPFGYRWSFEQFIEEVSPEEFVRRAQTFFGDGTGSQS